MANTKNVVVFGGTGHQGSAFVRALAAKNTSRLSPAYTIHVFNRNSSSPVVERLSALPGVKMVLSPQYMEAPDDAFEAAGLEVGDIHGAFMVSGYMDYDKEVAQGASTMKVCPANRSRRQGRQVSCGARRQAFYLWLGGV